jgi:putative peptide zinc metalloprotease protein
MAVYYRFDKVLGLALASLAFFLMILLPIGRGGRTLYNHRGAIRPRLFGVIAALGLAAFVLAALFLEWSSKSVYPCYVASAKIQKISLPVLTTVSEVLVEEGRPAKQGTPILELNSIDLEHEIKKKKFERNVVEGEERIMLLDDAEKHKAAGKAIEVQQKEADVEKIVKDLEKAKTGFIAPFDGVVTQLDPKVQDGFRPGEGVIVGSFESVDEAVVHVLIPERDYAMIAEMIRTGHQGTAWFPMETGAKVQAKLDEIRGYSEKDLAATPFTSRLGGEIATEQVQVGEDKKNPAQQPKTIDAPLEAQYIALYYFDNRALKLPLGLTGRYAVSSPPKSLAKRVWDEFVQTFNRESLF